MDGLAITGLMAVFTAGTGAGAIVGLRVRPDKLKVCWTERHPREVAADVVAGRISIRELTPESQTLVIAELARMRNGLTAAESAEFLAVTGVGGRYVGRPEPDWVNDAA